MVSQVITGLSAGTSYDARVFAFNAAGSGPVSSPVATLSTTNIGRNPYLQPFAPADFWNIGVGSLAQWTTPAEAQTAKLVTLNGVFNTNGNFNQPFYLGTAADVLVAVTVNDSQTFPCATMNIRIPIGAAPAGPLVGGDHHINLFDRTQPNKMFSFYFVSFNNADGNGAVTSATTTMSAVFGSVYDNTGSGVYPFGTRAFPAIGTGTVGYYNYGAGVIRDWELTAGSINHALRYVMGEDVVSSPGNFFNVGIPWPDYVEDFCGPATALTGCPRALYTGVIKYGATIGIPANVNLTTLGLTAGGLMLAKCIQTYGMVIRDTGSTGLIALYTENLSAPNLAMVTSQMQPDFNSKIVPLLRIMTNQSTDGVTQPINGGGTYPPPLPHIDTSLV